MEQFTRGCGVALMGGGGLLALLNLVLSPLLPTDQGEEILRTSLVYLLRLSCAEVSVILLLFGAVGLHIGRKSAPGVLGTLAFLVAFIGTSLMVALEWANIFVLRALAQTSPDALAPLDDSLLLIIGFASAAGLFMLGWLALSISIWWSRDFPRWAASTSIAGLLLIPLLGATPLGVYGAIAGNVCFGVGLAGLGYALFKRPQPDTAHG